MDWKHSSPYDLLGVPSDATAAEITSAYRRQLRTLHPDSRGLGLQGGPGTNAGPEGEAGPAGEAGSEGDAGASDSAEALRRVLEAYALLHDPEKRAAYDRRIASRARRPSARPGAASGAADRTSSGSGSAFRPAGQDFLLRAGPVQWQREWLSEGVRPSH